jgi:hypothetical protein
MKRIATIVAISVLTTAAGCYYDDEETLYPGSADCGTVTQANFSSDIMPLLNAKCNNCHSGQSPSGGIRLDTYSEVMKGVNNGSLMGSIQHAAGFSAMPKNGSKMSTCQIQKIQRWIDSGTVNN